MIRLALTAWLLAGCGPSHLERAKMHRRQALEAHAAGDMLSARGEIDAAIAAAEASIAAPEGEDGQAWLLKAWGYLALGDAGQVAPALKKARALHRGGAPDWQRRVLVAAHCQLAQDGGWHHYAALCFDHLLGALQGASEGLRIFATEGLANADAQRRPGYSTLVTYDAPLFGRIFGSTRASPMDGDLLAILAARLSRFCGDPAFVANIHGWRCLRHDLATAAAGLDAFTTDDRRRGFAKALQRYQKVPLCPRIKEGLDVPPCAVRPSRGPAASPATAPAP